MNKKDKLILEMIEEIKKYELEIIALRAYIFEDNQELVSDLTPSFIYDEVYRKLIKQFGDPFEDKEFTNEIDKIKRTGYSNRHPFSI